MEGLIKVVQLPIIEQQLKELGLEIDKKVETANALVCTEETRQSVKQLRTQFEKEFKELEAQRKAVKNKILEPYQAFEEIYKENITEKYANAKVILDSKIAVIENSIIDDLKNGAITYFEEYSQQNNIDFLTFERLNIKVGLSDNPTKLKKQVTSFIDKVVDELALIETQEHKAEILVEYKSSLNVAQAITIVSNRFKAIEVEKKRQEELAKIKEQEQTIVRKVEEVVKMDAPVVEQVTEQVSEQVNEPTYIVKFYVRGTKAQLGAVKEFLERGAYDYGSIQ